MELTHPAVRDLAWTIGSPALLGPEAGLPLVDDAFGAAALEAARPWLLALDRAPAPLETFLARGAGHRLGRYFERLVEFWLRHTPGLELIAHNVALRRDKHTLGEFDFVFSKPEWGGSQHWESVVKFYLQLDPGRGFAGYVGPTSGDVLADRIAKLARQIRLSAEPEAGAALGLPTPLPGRVLIRGYLFHPRDHGQADLPHGVSPHHLRGWWCRHGSARFDPRRRYRILPRLAWLAPARVRDGTPHALFSAAALEAILSRHFASATTPVLVAELEADDRGWWNECARGFIMPPHWPQAAKG